MKDYVVCERCSSVNLREIITGYEIKGNIYRIITKKCKDCGHEKTFKESMIPRKFKQEKEQEKRKNDKVERNSRNKRL